MATIDIIKEILGENLSIDPESINEESTFASLEIDSLDMVELVCELEDRLDVELGDTDEMSGIQTLGEFVDYIDNL